MKNKEIKTLKRYCLECNGEGHISICCNDYVSYENKCGVDDEVDIFVCIYSPKYLKQMLYNSKKIGDVKSFRGKIIDIVDDFHVKIKIGRKKHIIKIEDVDII